MIVYRPPFDVTEALGRGEQQRVPMKGRTVRECMGYDGLWRESPSEWGRWPEHLRRERLVSPIQPATRCPDCDCGNWPNCPTCDGAMWLGGDLGLVTEQERVMHDGQWDGWRARSTEADINAVMAKLEANGYVERRLVVPWRTQVTELLPVILTCGVESEMHRTPHVEFYDGAILLADGLGGYTDVGNEPWAQHLPPGMFVATLVGLWPIDPPVVDMRPCIGDDHPCQGDMCWQQETAGVSCAVPLSVDPGEVVTL